MRRSVTYLMIAGGLILIVVSYFFLAAPWGASAVRNSNPRIQFAPLIFVLGVVIAFLSAVVYELIPEREDDD